VALFRGVATSRHESGAPQTRLSAKPPRKGRSPAELRDRCSSFVGAEETFSFGADTSVFKVAGRMFALCQLAATPLIVSLKCEPSLAEALRESHAAVLPGYRLNKRHWNTVILDGSHPE
jgi:predicted DNA-binding protein (MmcQ/YjbR family)